MIHPKQFNLTRQQVRRSAILLLVLIVLAGITILATGLAYRTRVEIQLVKNYAQRAYLYHLALGGIERAAAHLSEFHDLPPTQRAKLYSIHTNAKEEDLLTDIVDPNNEPYLAYCIKDELGYLNINRYDSVVWSKLTPCLSPSRREYLLNWRSTILSPNPNGEQGEFYGNCIPPYRIKNQNYENLKELLYVKTITPDIYTGIDLEKRLFVNSEQRTGWQTLSNDPAGEQFGLIHVFTVYGDGFININTAPAYILSTLPQMTDSLVNALISYRAGNDGRINTDDDVFFQDPNDIDAHAEFQSLNRDCFCYTSDYYRLFSFAKLKNGVSCTLMATAKLSDNNKVQLLYVETLPTQQTNVH